jgi:hypothetical protein
MLRHRPVLTGIALALLLVVGNPAFADRERGSEQRRSDSPPRALNHQDRNTQNRSDNVRRDFERRDFDRREADRRDNNRREVERRFPDRQHVQHRDSYRPGYRVNVLPRHHVVVPYRNTRYYFDGGLWYRPFGSFFEVALPPVGLSISLLPPYYSTIWAGGVPYYHADGVYYAWRPSERNYVVVEPPAGVQAEAMQSEVPQPERLFIYPREGQSEEQQAEDRFTCHRWAVEQTGFDPSNPGNQATEQNPYRPEEYQRATRACLESRGYSVR